MACNKCKLVKCGCQDTYLTTPPPCPDPGDCPEAQPCSEVFDAACIIYNGDPILCGEDEVVSNNTSLSDAITAVVAYFCTTSGHELQQALICGEDTVVAAGSDLDTTLQGIVSYFCGRLSTLESQVGNNTTALLGSVTTGTASCVTVNDCTTCSISLEFRDQGNNLIDTATINLPEICGPEAICNSPVAAPGPPPGTARVVLCNNGDPLLVDVDEFALASDVPTTIVESVVAGTNVTVDNTDPANPIVSAAGGGGGGLNFVTLNSSADPSGTVNVATLDTLNPLIVSVKPNTIYYIEDMNISSVNLELRLPDSTGSNNGGFPPVAGDIVELIVDHEIDTIKVTPTTTVVIKANLDSQNPSNPGYQSIVSSQSYNWPNSLRNTRGTRIKLQYIATDTWLLIDHSWKNDIAAGVVIV
jgi:hypothetical protein